MKTRLFWLIPLCACLASVAQEVLPNTRPLTLQGDLSAQMVAGIDRFLTRATEQSIGERQQYWQRDFSSVGAYDKSVQPNRERLRRIIGAVDARLPVSALEFVSSTASPAKVGETDAFTAEAVRWPVFEGVYAEGLRLQPKGEPVACIVAIPDADQTPEMLVGLAPGLPPERQFARRLAENGCEVLVPVLIDRQDTWSGNPRINRLTNQPHREWIHRQAFMLGRHIIGYEVQKVLAGVDWFERQSTPASPRNTQPATRSAPIGLAGYAEGGLIAFYAAALDRRVAAVLVSGYFDSRQSLWEEPICRNVFGLLREFGDAEIASLIAPRALVIEYSAVPKVDGPPAPREGRMGAAPGRLQTPEYDSVEAEFDRAHALLKTGKAKDFNRFTLISGTEGQSTGPGSDRALAALLNALGVSVEQLRQPGQSRAGVSSAPAQVLADLRPAFDPGGRQQRQVKELEDYTQRLLRESEHTRAGFFWDKVNGATAVNWETSCAPFKQILWEQVIGRLPSPALPANARSRRLSLPSAGQPSERSGSTSGGETAAAKGWTGYEVVLDVYPDVFAWGILLVPNDLKPAERRPVVVCQHGLEGVPMDVVTQDPKSDAFRYYKGFAARLAERGFVVFAPHNPYRGGNSFRQLQRKANPLGESLFSVITAQHSRILDWLSTLPFVDAKRIGFYGFSYGGTTAMRVPAVLDRYALSICSGGFNEWIRKNVCLDFAGSFMFCGEYEMSEFGLGDRFDYAELAALIAPRPFMVERGHSDTVGLDDWVAAEYAKVRRLYDQLGIADRTAIEFFDGGHTINGVGTFQFLHQHLNWPEPRQPRTAF
jgi:dienelactone hydrolase